MNASDVTKLWTFVFDDDSPLANVGHTPLVDGLSLGAMPQFILEKSNDYCVVKVEPHFSEYFDEHLCKVVLNVEYAGSSQLNHEGVRSDEEDAAQKATHWCIAAMLHNPRFLAPTAAFATIPDQSRICRSTRMLVYGYVPEPGEPHSNKPLSADDLAAINALYPVVREVLKNKHNGGLVTAIDYYQQAFHVDVSANIRFLSMIMGLECLFGNVFMEVSHTVSERVACFLEADGAKRLALYAAMKQNYSLRSKIAHGRQKQADQSKVGEHFPRVVWILRNAIVKTLSDPRLMKLFDSNSEELNTAFNSLVFYGSLEKWLTDTQSVEATSARQS